MVRNTPYFDGFVDVQWSKFDLLLAAIPLTLLVGAASTAVGAVSQPLGISVSAAVAAALVGYGIYLIATTQTAPGESEAAAATQRGETVAPSAPGRPPSAD